MAENQRPRRGARTPSRQKLWSGRFLEATNPLVDAYTSSLEVDSRMAVEDVRGSIAHVRMLSKQSIIPSEDADKILDGLMQIGRDIEAGSFEMDESLEDVHMNVEARLAQIIGPEAAGRLHSARSRNDQVVTDLRMWLKTAIAETIAGLHDLEGSLVELATANRRVIIPGYTHLQRAQPVLLAHHLLAYFEMLERDIGRMADAYARTDVMGLGSGALAGVPYAIDREGVARDLEFSAISANSIDAVSDRDFVAEYLAAAAIAMMHVSRLAEDIVIWSTTEFGFVSLPDAFATGSSIMPQKKNPDIAELARGKTGPVYAALVSVLTTMKGLPLAYNRDMQEDKRPLFEAYDTLTSTLEIMSELVSRLEFNGARTRHESGGYLLATDLADYLTLKGMPFREAHGIVGRLVAFAEEEGRALNRLTIEEYNRFSPLFGPDVLDINPWSSVRSRDVVGGTAPRRVAAALRRARTILKRREES
jgi:argininosuccinate lyase